MPALLRMKRLLITADDGTGAPLAGDSTLKTSMVRIDFSGDRSPERSWQTAETAMGWDPDSQEMRAPRFVTQSIAATATTRPASIEAIGWAKVKRER